MDCYRAAKIVKIGSAFCYSNETFIEYYVDVETLQEYAYWRDSFTGPKPLQQSFHRRRHQLIRREIYKRARSLLLSQVLIRDVACKIIGILSRLIITPGVDHRALNYCRMSHYLSLANARLINYGASVYIVGAEYGGSSHWFTRWVNNVDVWYYIAVPENKLRNADREMIPYILTTTSFKRRAPFSLCTLLNEFVANVSAKSITNY